MQNRRVLRRINWNEPIPMDIPCPNCTPYLNLESSEWKFIQIRTPVPLKDYHKCPICERMFSISREHSDKLIIEKKKGAIVNGNSNGSD